MAALDAATSPAIASRPSFSPRASATTSLTFSKPKANQLRSASSRSGSASSVYGTCSVEHDVDTATWFAEPSSVASVPSAASKSVRQMLRPSTIPATTRLARQLGDSDHRGAPAGDQVDANRLNGRASQRGQRVAEFTEVGRHEQRWPLGQCTQPGVCALGELCGVAEDVGHQHGLIELNPLDPVVSQKLQEFGIHGDEFVEPAHGCACPINGLAQCEERDRSDDHRPGWNIKCASLFQLAEHLGRVEREKGVGPSSGTR